MSNEDGFLCEMFSFENCCIKEVISLFHISAVGFIFGMGFVSFFEKMLGLFCNSPKERKRHQWNIFIGISMLD